MRPEVRAASSLSDAQWKADQARAHDHSWDDVLDAIEMSATQNAGPVFNNAGPVFNKDSTVTAMVNGKSVTMSAAQWGKLRKVQLQAAGLP